MINAQKYPTQADLTYKEENQVPLVPLEEPKSTYTV